MRIVGLILALGLAWTCEAQRIEVNQSVVRPNNHLRPSPSEFPFELSVSESYDLQFNLVDGELIFSEPSFGGWDFFFPVTPGDVIGDDTIHDYELAEVTPLKELPMGQSYLGYAFADVYEGNPDFDIFALYSWLRLERDENGFEVLESFVARGAINGQRLPVVTVGAFQACFFDTLGDIDGDGSVAFNDFLVLSANFGQDVVTNSLGDIDCNGTVEFADFLILSSNYETNELSNVPEPTANALLLLVLTGFCRMHTRRMKRFASATRCLISQ